MAQALFQVLEKDLNDPVVVYSQGYASCTLTEKHARESCEIVGKILNNNYVYFSGFDSDRSFSISVSKSDLDIVKKIAQQSKLEWWIKDLHGLDKWLKN